MVEGSLFQVYPLLKGPARRKCNARWHGMGITTSGSNWPVAGTAWLMSSPGLELVALMHVQWISDEQRALATAAAVCCLPFGPYI